MYNPILINPIDLKPSIAVGVSLPFNGSAVFNSTYTTKDQIRSNILNLFLTSTNEKMFEPNLGLDLNLFDQITNETIDNIKYKIENAIEVYFPNVNITSLNVFTSNNDNTISIKVSYKINNTNIEDNLNIIFQQ